MTALGRFVNDAMFAARVKTVEALLVESGEIHLIPGGARTIGVILDAHDQMMAGPTHDQVQRASTLSERLFPLHVAADRRIQEDRLADPLRASWDR